MSQRRMTDVSRPPEYARTTRLGSGVIERASQELQHDGLLRVQAILGLLQEGAALAVEHGVGDLLAAMGRQAVHHERGRLGEAEERIIDLVAAEGLEPLLALGLLPHA